MIKTIIIEDQPEIRQALQAIIAGSAGFQCIQTFENAEDALNKMPYLNFDVALVDINLPGITGIELIQTLKPEMPEKEFIILTVFEDNNNIFNALKAGASGYLLKSTPPAKILEAITEVFNGGSPMSAQIARKVITSFATTQEKPKNKELQSLTPRELETLTLLSKGYRYKEIANTLFISTETVRTHIRNIYQKLQVQSGIEAVNKFLNHS